MKELLREKHCTKVLVLDASAIFSSIHMLVPDCLVTTPEVYDEIKDSASYNKTLLSIELSRLIVTEPPDIKVELPRKISDKLSRADKSLLKLAFYLKKEGFEVYLATDDYTLEKAALKLGIDYMPTKTIGIKKLSNFK
ncbi:MAG: hypothetical protein LM585_04970 [Fervidicoccaceae archaeon]|jgi:UPF0271 protein|nr:hypothetical protein [Fervidicoccaceae archaeon]MCC6052569.1 hypothetical protein [Fervidicoccaceae archaeon]NAZ12508.1 hypothetical protein [Desulfurococcales archaeon]